MSRLIVKNLPDSVTEKHLIDHFSKFGLVTDAKLKYKRNGTFRGFAFLGFESNEIAEKVHDYFKDTYFRQNKIIVEFCKELDCKTEKGNADIHKKLEEKHNLFKQFDESMEKKDELTKEKLTDLMKKPEFLQFLKVKQKSKPSLIKSLKKLYDLDRPSKQEKKDGGEENEEEKHKLANKEISDSEYLEKLIKSSEGNIQEKGRKKIKENFFTVFIRAREKTSTNEKRGKIFTKQFVKKFLAPIKYQSLRIPPKRSYNAYIGFKKEKDMKNVLLKDGNCLDGIVVRVHKYVAPEIKNAEYTGEHAPWASAEENLIQKANPISESGKLFVRNLWYSATEEDLRGLFEEIGPLADVTLPLSKITRKPKGFAHVSFIFPEHAVKALNELDGKFFKGRMLHILPSLEKDEDESEHKSFKELKKDDLKKSAGSWHNWNSLFLGSSAVIDLMADNFGHSKHQLFEDRDGQSVAVNLALGETQIVDETKRFLEDEGVSLEAFSNPNVQRSSTVILAKNLPAKTSAQELRELFGRYGELDRVLLPPSGITCIIEYLDPGEAKQAFQGLAYSKFKYLPLYLEWAPVLVFKNPTTKSSLPNPSEKSQPENLPPSTEENAETPKNYLGPEPNTTIYIKNLNIDTDEATIEQHFSEFGDVYSVLISKRRGISQGYGFVQYVNASAAKRALLNMQNYHLDGNNLTLKFSEKKLEPSSSEKVRKFLTPGEPTSAKIIVKNIPFQATSAEIRLLFRTFGELKSVRLPLKPTGEDEHRGFGFVEFSTVEEAKKAFNSLGSSTHLYGRRLVLEWANEDESVEDLRRKTAQQFLGSEHNKRRKVEV